jgi:chromosomal replication initiation ATPase DnaA
MLFFLRHLAMYILYKKLKLSYPKTARALKRTDHTTAIHAVDRVQKLIDSDKVRLSFK